MVNMPAGAAVGDQRKWRSLADRASEGLSQSVVHDIAHGQSPLGRTALGSSQEFVVNYECSPHTDEHTYAKVAGQAQCLLPALLPAMRDY